MKTLIIKSTAVAKGNFPRSNMFSIRLFRNGDGTGLIGLHVYLNSFKTMDTNDTRTIEISGGKFIINGAEVASYIWDGSPAKTAILCRVDADVAYIYIHSDAIYSFREINSELRTENSPFIDYNSGFGDLNNTIRQFFNNQYFNAPIYGLKNPVYQSREPSLDSMFTNALLFNQEVSFMNTSNVVSMSSMFSYASSFNQPLAGLDVGKVVDMSYMLRGTRAFDQDISMLNYNINVNLEGFLNQSGLSPVNYTKFLQKLDNLDFTGRTTPKSLGADGVKHSSAGTAIKASLIAKGWTISDAGVA